jgi:hypothetical protein
MQVAEALGKLQTTKLNLWASYGDPRVKTPAEVGPKGFQDQVEVTRALLKTRLEKHVEALQEEVVALDPLQGVHLGDQRLWVDRLP